MIPEPVRSVDQLYRSVVTEPERWNEATFAEWLEGLASDPALGPDEAKAVRRALCAAVKLAAFWSDRERADDVDWEARVDLALGARAWRPTLDLALALLERDPSPALFEHVGRRFRLVTSQPFLDGLTYDEWSAGNLP